MDWFRKAEVVVTGGAGFIGSHLVEKLLTLGTKVTVIDKFLHGSKIEHLRGHESLSVCEGDIKDAKFVSDALQNKDLVFHLAAVVGIEETQMAPLEVLDVEIQGVLNVLNIAASNGIKRVIFISSSEVYGNATAPMKEEGPLSPKSTYAVAKLVGEEYCKAFHQKYGVEYTCLRYFNVYGPRQDDRFVIPYFVKRALSNESLEIYGDGEQTRDFTYIDDAVNLSLIAAIKPEAKCQAVNIGTGIKATINEVARLVTKALNSNNPVKFVYIDYNDTRPREIEVFNRVADIAKAKKYLSCEPEISLELGIRKYVEWYLEKEGKLS